MEKEKQEAEEAQQVAQREVMEAEYSEKVAAELQQVPISCLYEFAVCRGPRSGQ